MRAAIGLIGLGVLSGIAPTGLPGIAYAAPVLAGAAGALVVLVAGCVACASFSPRRARRSASVTARRPLGRVAAAAPSAPRIV